MSRDRYVFIDILLTPDNDLRNWFESVPSDSSVEIGTINYDV